VHLNSWCGSSWISTSFTRGGAWQRGLPPLRSCFCSHSENQAKWQLQVKGFESRFLKEKISSSFPQNCKKSNRLTTSVPSVYVVLSFDKMLQYLRFPQQSFGICNDELLGWVLPDILKDSGTFIFNNQACYWTVSPLKFWVPQFFKLLGTTNPETQCIIPDDIITTWYFRGPLLL
jgi:hypothetical protein